MVAAIIVAAGSSRRVGFDKLTARVAGEPLIVHTVKAFQETTSVADVVIVTRADRLREFERFFAGTSKIHAIVAGGEHRQDSVEAGLRTLSDVTEYVAVHDGARPLVQAEQIEQVFEQARIHGAASLAEPVRDTLKRAADDLLVRQSIDRHHVYAMQTPQVFRRSLLEQAYKAVATSGRQVTDEVSAVELLGHRVMLVPNAEVNFKITFERDLQLAEAVLLRRQQLT
jgi:2-C-methyl-D-erythritol 4-phosphate cytidylyltransferase